MGENSGQYRLTALVKDGDQVEIRTSSRVNARHYASVLLVNPAYSHVQVESGGKLWIGEAIGRMP